MRILKSSQYTLPSPTFVGADGDTAANCASTPTCTITRENGTALTAAVVTQADVADLGNYQAAITTTHTSQLDRLTATWTGTAGGLVQVYTQELEVVGGHYVTIPQLRNFDDLGDATRYPVALLRELLDEFEDICERACGQAFVRRYQRDLLDGNGTNALTLTKANPRTILSVTVNGVAQTTSEFDVDSSTSELTWRSGTFWNPDTTNGEQNIAVAYEYGRDFAPPALARQALICVRGAALEQRSAIPANAISQTFEGVTIRFGTPDASKGRPTGIQTLDAVLVELGLRIPGMA